MQKIAKYEKWVINYRQPTKGGQMAGVSSRTLHCYDAERIGTAAFQRDEIMVYVGTE